MFFGLLSKLGEKYLNLQTFRANTGAVGMPTASRPWSTPPTASLTTRQLRGGGVAGRLQSSGSPVPGTEVVRSACAVHITFIRDGHTRVRVHQWAERCSWQKFSWVVI